MSAGMLEDGHVATGPPAKDLDRARAFSSKKLCLGPAAERPGGLRSERRRRRFSLFRIGRHGSGHAHADGVEGRRHRGRVDLPGLRTVDVWVVTTRTGPGRYGRAGAR
jgi:hypothetical protein